MQESWRGTNEMLGMLTGEAVGGKKAPPAWIRELICEEEIAKRDWLTKRANRRQAEADAEVKEKLSKVIKAHRNAGMDAKRLYGQLVKAADIEAGDGNSIASAKRNIVTAVKSLKEWMQLFGMYMQFKTDDYAISEATIKADIDESKGSLELLFQACEDAKVLTCLALEA